MIRYGFRAPTDIEVLFHVGGEKALVGKTAMMSLFGEPHHRVRILAARAIVADDLLGPGVWLDLEALDMPEDVRAIENATVTGKDGETTLGPPAVISARICPLDAEGNPTGEWREL